MNKFLILTASFITVFLIFLIIGLLQLILIVEKTEQEKEKVEIVSYGAEEAPHHS